MTTRPMHTAAVATSAVSGGLLFTGFMVLLADVATPSWASDKSTLDWATGTILTLGTVSFLVGMGLLSTAISRARVSAR